MSELKAMTVLDVQQMGCYDNVFVYFKSEADKYIGELKKEIESMKVKFREFNDNVCKDCYGSVTGKINFCPICGRPLNKTFPNELKADEKLCIKYEKEWIDGCRKNENKIIPYTAIPSEKVEELESLIRSAESIFEGLVNVGIFSFFLKLKDHYEVAYRAF